MSWPMVNQRWAVLLHSPHMRGMMGLFVAWKPLLGLAKPQAAAGPSRELDMLLHTRAHLPLHYTSRHHATTVNPCGARLSEADRGRGPPLIGIAQAVCPPPTAPAAAPQASRLLLATALRDPANVR